jgi:hypothetical protein
VVPFGREDLAAAAWSATTVQLKDVARDALMRSQRIGWIRFWAAIFVAALAVVVALAVVAAVVPDWIEEVFGAEPDGGSGALEWALTPALAGVAGLALWTARAEWRRLSATETRDIGG